MHRHAFTNHLTSVTTCFPLLPGCHSLPHISISPRNSSLFPISWVHHHTFTKHLTSAITCFPRLPGYQTLPRMHIPPLAFFSFPYFRGASLDFGAATHLGATCFPPLSGVPLPVSHRHLTPQTSLPPRLPGCQPLPHMHISPLAFFSFPHFRGATPCLTSVSHPANIFLPPAFRGAPLRHTDLGHLSLRNYFYGAENAQDFLRRRRCGVQNCLKKRDKAEKVPIAYRNRNFFLYIFSSFLHETSFSFFERKSCILLRRNSFCKGKMPKILRDNLLRTFLCTFSAALAFEWIDRRKVVF